MSVAAREARAVIVDCLSDPNVTADDILSALLAARIIPRILPRRAGNQNLDQAVQMVRNGASYRQVARKFGHSVKYWRERLIICGVGSSHSPGVHPRPIKWTRDRVNDVRRLVRAGKTAKEIAALYDVTDHAVALVKHKNGILRSRLAC